MTTPAIRWVGQGSVAGYPDIMVKLPVDGVTALEIKTGEDPPLTDNQRWYIPMLQLGGHLYSNDPRIADLGLLPGLPFPPLSAYIIFAYPGEEYRAYMPPPPKKVP